MTAAHEALRLQAYEQGFLDHREEMAERADFMFRAGLENRPPLRFEPNPTIGIAAP